MEKNDLMSIEELEITRAAKNALLRAGIRTVGDVRRLLERPGCGYSELAQIRGVGRKTLRALLEAVGWTKSAWLWYVHRVGEVTCVAVSRRGDSEAVVLIITERGVLAKKLEGVAGRDLSEVAREELFDYLEGGLDAAG